ncbi:hypothetical protein HELRODRAFT_110003 [Helobdella robusta]|uniref:Protein kinase domain-containing protein n=1 Tax=Helobdella robusta TaxID=6412 RepID=T1EEY2_HELRO|nr:hypothetical protein HELRODRAFT_110003 [Helobdella robusta]ESO09060.1 hypothetical protein HELRODRAFT_110003 [Helobdella robusta]
MSKSLSSSPSLYSNLKLCTLIGQGSFDYVMVYLARKQNTNQVYAVKIIDLDKCELNLETIKHEMTMHKTLKHKNILPIIDNFVMNGCLWVIMPLCGFGSCKDLIHAHFHAGLPELCVALILKDVLSALVYLHSRYIIHRGLRASHVVVNGDGVAMISGLTHCYSMLNNGVRLKTVHDFPDFYIRNLNWASRELLEQNLAGYNTQSDIYSLGVMTCELANGVIPFYDMPMTQMLLNKLEGRIPTLLDETTYGELNRIQPGEDIPDVYKRSFTRDFHVFTNQCLTYDPNLRPTAVQLESHSFFKQTRQKNLPSLAELLQPITSLNHTNIPNQDEMDLTSLEQDMRTVDLDVEWKF